MSHLPIRELSPYHRNWKIQARVTNKSPMRDYASKNSNPGKVFSIELLDKDGGEIRGTFFGNEAVKFHDMIQIGKVFEISKGNIKVANKKYTNVNHNYEITFSQATEIKEVSNSPEIEHIKYRFVKLREVANKPLFNKVDLLVAVKDFKAPRTIVTKADNREVMLREITVVDSSEFSMDLTLWGETAEQLKEETLLGKPILAFKGITLREQKPEGSDKASRSGAVNKFDQINVNAQEAVPAEFKEMSEWWMTFQASGRSTTDLSEGGYSRSGNAGPSRKEISFEDLEAEAEEVTTDVYYSCVGRVKIIRATNRDGNLSVMYEACPKCNRKVPDDQFCLACNEKVEPNPRYLIQSVLIGDYSGASWLNVIS